ncbi:MAG: 3'-5' exonuclease, partial [Rectinemataceae bacterium]
EGLAEFLETVELDRGFQSGDGQENKDAVSLITMHNTKGLEFPLVIVTGLEQGLFPRDDEEGDDLEEQRRLFYVALTRAKDSLYLSACRWRRMRGRLFETTPSRFLTEMDPKNYEFWKSGPSVSRPLPAHFPKPLPSSSPGPRVAASTGPEWKPGQTVYHDEYGQGSILKVNATESSGPLVIVRFDSGKIAQFFPKYTRKLERIKE